MSKSKTGQYSAGGEAFAAWRGRVERGESDPVYVAGNGALARFAIGPGRVTLLGGAPGQGKTALSMQIITDALRMNPELRACVCNVEMSTEALLDRQAARLSGISLTTIRKRVFGPEHSVRLDAAFNTMEPVVERMCFVTSPFNLENVAATADDFKADILILDYIQRIRPPGDHSDKRGSVDAAMDSLRKFAANGIAVVVIAALARTKNKRGQSSYDSAGLGLASFRESSELEYGADDAYLLVPHKDEGLVLLKHLKARSDEPGDIELEFDKPLQRFTDPESDEASPGKATARSQLAAMWDKTKPAGPEDNP